MKRLLFIVALLAWVPWAPAAEPATAPATQPQAAALLAQIQAVQPPEFDDTKQSDPAYIRSYLKARSAVDDKRNDLIKDFFTRFPEHSMALKLMSARWIMMAQHGHAQEVLDESDPVLARTTGAAARAEILLPRAVAALSGDDAAKGAAAVDEFIKAAPQDESGGALLLMAAHHQPDQQKQAALYRRAADAYPQTSFGQTAQAHLKQLESIGKPFELTFTDALSGKAISVQKDLKGKVVVIDFWATWCGPCVAEMPDNKLVYEKYHAKGVEFIGVSLDQSPEEGGLAALKDFVAQNGLPWPQYYQGNGGTSEFSSRWNIRSIPSMFLVDKDGKLSSIDADGQLEKLIPKLLGTEDTAPEKK